MFNRVIPLLATSLFGLTALLALVVVTATLPALLQATPEQAAIPTWLKPFTQLHPVIAIHLMAAVCALMLGPVIFWRPKGTTSHKLLGRVWVLLMLTAAVSSLWIRDRHLPNIAGYTPIHIVTVLTFLGISVGMWHVLKGRIAAHRRTMIRTYVGGCIIAGLFAFAPSRFLGHWLWHTVLGWI